MPRSSRTLEIPPPAGGPRRIRICLAAPGGSARDLTPRERILLARRTRDEARADFIAGRRAAHALLGPGAEVLRARGGAPRIAHPRSAAPRSLSIAHSRGWGLAALAEGARWRVGADVEARRALPEKLATRILTPRERRRRGDWLAQWVLKEAALKAAGRSVLELLADAASVEVAIYRRSGWCRLRIGGRGRGLGRVFRMRGLTLALVLLPASGSRELPR